MGIGTGFEKGEVIALFELGPGLMQPAQEARCRDCSSDSVVWFVDCID